MMTMTLQTTLFLSLILTTMTTIPAMMKIITMIMMKVMMKILLEQQDATISMTACPLPALQVKSHPSSSITIQPKSAFSRLITQSDRNINRNIRTGFYHHNDSLTMSVWKGHNDWLILRLFNDSDHPISVQLSQPRFHKPHRSVRILPVDLKKWAVNNSPTPSPKGANGVEKALNVNLGRNNSAVNSPLCRDAIDKAIQQLQSSFCHYPKNLDNLSRNSFFLFQPISKNHPFGQDTYYWLQFQTYPEEWRRIKTNGRLLRPLCPPASFSPHWTPFPKGQGPRDVFKAFPLYRYIGSLSISRLPKKTTFSWKDITSKHSY